MLYSGWTIEKDFCWIDELNSGRIEERETDWKVETNLYSSMSYLVNLFGWITAPHLEFHSGSQFSQTHSESIVSAGK